MSVVQLLTGLKRLCALELVALAAQPGRDQMPGWTRRGGAPPVLEAASEEAWREARGEAVVASVDEWGDSAVGATQLHRGWVHQAHALDWNDMCERNAAAAKHRIGLHATMGRLPQQPSPRASEREESAARSNSGACSTAGELLEAPVPENLRAVVERVDANCGGAGATLAAVDAAEGDGPAAAAVRNSRVWPTPTTVPAPQPELVAGVAPDVESPDALTLYRCASACISTQRTRTPISVCWARARRRGFPRELPGRCQVCLNQPAAAGGSRPWVGEGCSTSAGRRGPPHCALPSPNGCR